MKLFFKSFPFALYFPVLFRIVQATTLYSGHSFGVADTRRDIVQYDLGKVKHTAEYATFFLVNSQSTNDL
ncbi:MAG TPA: hypothetical protein VIV35_11420 [Chitinophagaceae bacterium]